MLHALPLRGGTLRTGLVPEAAASVFVSSPRARPDGAGARGGAEHGADAPAAAVRQGGRAPADRPRPARGRAELSAGVGCTRRELKGPPRADIACTEAKHHYSVLRPSQVDSTIRLADRLTLPNFHRLTMKESFDSDPN